MDHVTDTWELRSARRDYPFDRGAISNPIPRAVLLLVSSSRATMGQTRVILYTERASVRRVALVAVSRQISCLGREEVITSGDF